MKRSTLIAFAVLLLASITVGEQLSLDQIREEVLQRIQAANTTVPASTKGAGGKNLQSYRIIDPYMIADLLTGMIYIYSTILYNYPDFVQYDFADLRLLGVRYVPQRVELNYVKRV
uniref:Uncharacterized protein n=1 Tax=Anopheles maculatus TaxID=74869 RepID=A0A182SQH7_9DIPT